MEKEKKNEKKKEKRNERICHPGTVTNLTHCLHVLSPRHVLSSRGDKSCRKEQHYSYNLSALSLWTSGNI